MVYKCKMRVLFFSIIAWCILSISPLIAFANEFKVVVTGLNVSTPSMVVCDVDRNGNFVFVNRRAFSGQVVRSNNSKVTLPGIPNSGKYDSVHSVVIMSPTEIYTSSRYSGIHKYNGSSWTKLNVPNHDYYYLFKDNYNNLYIIGASSSNSYKYIYRWNGSSATQVGDRVFSPVCSLAFNSSNTAYLIQSGYPYDYWGGSSYWTLSGNTWTKQRSTDRTTSKAKFFGSTLYGLFYVDDGSNNQTGIHNFSSATKISEYLNGQNFCADLDRDGNMWTAEGGRRIAMGDIYSGQLNLYSLDYSGLQYIWEDSSSGSIRAFSAAGYILELSKNSPPTIPGAFTSPTSGQQLKGGSSITVRWGSSSDPDGDTIRYQLQFYNGSSWSNVTSSTTSTSYTWTVPTSVTTSNAKFRVRAYDGKEYSSYRESSTFSITQNSPPTTPSRFYYPSGSEMAGSSVWFYHGESTDPDGDTVTYQVEIRYRSTSGSWGSWSSVRNSTSTSGYYTISSSTSYNAFQMRVRASDGKGGYSNYLQGNTVSIIHNRAPDVSLSSPSSGYTTGSSSVTFSWSASDPDGDPITSTLFVDGSSRGNVSGAGSKSLTVYGLSDGNHTWYVRVNDGTTYTNSPSRSFTVDTTPPNISFSPSSRSWSPSNISVTVNVTDTYSGVSTKQYAWSNSTSTPSSWSTLGSSVSQTGNGTWYLHVRATDGMGNTRTTYSGPYYKDDIKPTLTIGDPPTSWQNSNISVNVQHSDSGGSGVATKRYAVTSSTSKPGSGWTALTSTNQNITISNDGQWYLHVQIIDGAGNETYQYKGPFKVDRTAPTVTITSPPTEWRNTDFTVNIQHNADVSGSAIKRYAVTNSTSKPSSGWTDLTSTNQNITISDNGAWYVHVQVIDNAGNETHKYSGPFKLDKTTPTGSFTVTDRTGLPKTITPEVRLNMNFSDTYSGLDTVEISTDNKTWSPKLTYQDYYDWVVDNKAGIQYVYVRVYDKAGNMTISSSGIQIVEDITGPTVELIINNHAESTEVKNVNLTINASDDYSKVEKMRFSNNAIQWTPWEDYKQTKNDWDLTAEAYGGNLEVGLKTVYVQVYDTFSNTSMAQASISYTAGGFKLEPGDIEFYSDSGNPGTYQGKEVRFVKEPTVQIKSNYENVSQMQFTFDDWAWTTWEPYATSKTVELEKFEGLTRVNAKARTSAGAISAKQDIYFVVDMTKPTVTVKTLNGATATTTGSIELVIDVKDNISTTFEYKVNGSNFKPLPSDGKITVSGLTPGNFNEIKVEVRDQAGNVVEGKVSVWYIAN